MADGWKGGPVSGPTPPARRTTSTGSAAAVAAAGAWGAIKVAFAIFGLLLIGLGVWGYHRAHTPEFKLECAEYQEHIVSMSFPDNALCLLFWNT